MKIKKAPTLILAGLLSVSLFSPSAEAKVVGHIVQDNADGKQYEFSMDDLNESFTIYLRNPEHAKAALFLKYLDVRSNGNLSSLLDDPNGYIDYNDVNKNYLASLRSGKAFDLNQYTESSVAKKVEPNQLHKVTKNDDGTFEIVPAGDNTDDELIVIDIE